jgi:hypothetical protein
MHMIVIRSLLLLCFCTAAVAAPISVEVMLPETTVDVEGDRNVFATPFDYRDGNLFTIHVEPPADSGKDGANLRTVVRDGRRQADGTWNWSNTLVEDRTIRDAWHTQASVALDKEGYVHVAYNMHNMPWQYSVSTRPMDISSFEFRGQPVTMAEIETVKFKNKTPFPTLGSAAIPGTQVTYPSFYKNAAGDLFLTYRFSLKPARSWEQRAFAGGVARYDTASRKWSPIGGAVQISEADARFEAGKVTATLYPFSYEETYSIYLTTLSFDADGGMHAFWNWRAGGAGMDTISPSYGFSPDGQRILRSDGAPYRLPITLKDADIVVPQDRPNSYYAPKSVAVLPNGEPVVVIQPLTGGRQLISLDRASRRWRQPEATPASASEIVVDKQGRLWAFASGLKVFVRSSLEGAWEEVGEIGRNLCYPKVKYFPAESRFVVRAKTCDEQRITIVSFRR